MTITAHNPVQYSKPPTMRALADPPERVANVHFRQAHENAETAAAEC